MKRKILGGLVFLLTSAAVTGITFVSSAAQEPAASAPLATDSPPVRKLGRMDVRHPLLVGSDYYPKQSAFPRVADDYEIQAGGKFYPEAARVKQPRGSCVVHTTVDSNGTALNAGITSSTGSAILDKACLAAVTAARFTPELQDGRPVADSTDIAIYW